MSEHKKETSFLRHILVFDDTDERRKLEEEMAQIRRDERCVQRAASLMALFTALGAVGLAYGVVLQENFPYGTSRFVIKLICELGLASLISLVVFVGLSMAYRKKLNRLREECLRLVTKLPKSHLGTPHITLLRGSHLGAGDRQVDQGAVKVNGSRDHLDALREEVVHVVNKHP